MLSSPLFRKLFCVYAILSALATVSIASILGHRQRQIIYDQVHRRLSDSAFAMTNTLEDPFSSSLAPEVIASLDRIAAENGIRITLIAQDGTVVSDSEHDSQTMENHANRSEVLQANRAGIGSARRTSPTLSIPMLYVANRVGTVDEPIGYIRVAVPLDTVEAEVDSVQRVVVGTSVAVSLLALGPLFLILRRVVQPLTTLKTAANAIAEGDLEQKVHVDRHDELGTLAEAFNTMSQELSVRMQELNQTGEELRANSQLLSTVLGSMIEGVVAVDNDRNIIFSNKAAQRLLDFGTRNVLGRPVWECIRNETVSTVVNQALNGMERSVECELPRHDTIVEIEASPLAGTPCPGVVLVFHDITRLRRLENIRRDFASNVSHELKTPLTIIQTSAETLLDGAIEDTQFARRFLQRIEEQGRRLHDLIVDLLQLARIESKEQSFDLTAVSVQTVVESLMDEMLSLAQSRNVVLELGECEPDLQIAADTDAFRTIMQNLLSNGLKYTPEGGQVTVSWRAEESRAVIAVRDTGVGISRDQQARIFERFYRVDRARTREIGGTGLGLAIVKHLANTFDAQVSVESEIGRGSVFTLKIPLWTDSLAMSTDNQAD